MNHDKERAISKKQQDAQSQRAENMVHQLLQRGLNLHRLFYGGRRPIPLLHKA
jgi:hypothetical protein